METVDLKPLLQDLECEIDDLEDALEPILKPALSELAGKLPVLDKAKFYVLVTYAIESILFSCIKLNGDNAKEHPVFRELIRVKQYFEKIKTTETGDAKRENLSLDKQAAGRIIRHALTGSVRSDPKEDGEPRNHNDSPVTQDASADDSGRQTGHSRDHSARAVDQEERKGSVTSSSQTKKRPSASTMWEARQGTSKKPKQ